MLRLANRFSDDNRESTLSTWEKHDLITVGDQDSRTKEDWVQAKRHVLAVLRIQTGRTLYDVLVSRPEEVDEVRWIEEVHRDIALENARVGRQALPPTPTEAGYQIESIRSYVPSPSHWWQELMIDYHSMKLNPELSCIVSNLKRPVKSPGPIIIKDSSFPSLPISGRNTI
jgi:hypothetical protein